MELIIQSDSGSASRMKNAHNTMLETFGDSISLEKYFGPVQMEVWLLEYSYLPEKYKIRMECERGFITIEVHNGKGEFFYPYLIYSEADYYHYVDKKTDVCQLITLTHKAIAENEIRFFSKEEIIKRNMQR